jgi:hypothetical protein
MTTAETQNDFSISLNNIARRPEVKKRALPWQREVDWATQIAGKLGCTVERSAADYEIAKVKCDGVSLVIYPHKTTAGHHHARVRDNGSKRPEFAARIMQALNSGEGLPDKDSEYVRFSCVFSFKKLPGSV